MALTRVSAWLEESRSSATKKFPPVKAHEDTNSKQRGRKRGVARHTDRCPARINEKNDGKKNSDVERRPKTR